MSVNDTVTVTIVERPVQDTIALIQRLQIDELKKQVELQKTIVK